MSVDVRAAGANLLDVQQRSGTNRMRTPFTVGNEGAGVISAVGSDVDGAAVGDRVAWAMISGGHGPAAGISAHFLTRTTYAVQPGDDVLLHTAAGCTGLLLVQPAAGPARGARPRS